MNVVDRVAVLIHCTLAVSTLEDTVLWRSHLVNVVGYIVVLIRCTLAVSTLVDPVIWKSRK